MLEKLNKLLALSTKERDNMDLFISNTSYKICGLFENENRI